MKKSHFVALVFGVVGGILFALGMCMSLLREWGLFNQGVIAGVTGLIILLIGVMVWRKMEGKAPIKLDKKTAGTVFVGIVGALLLGIGMSLCMVFNKMVLGVIIGIVGIVILLMLIPLTKGIQ